MWVRGIGLIGKNWINSVFLEVVNLNASLFKKHYSSQHFTIHQLFSINFPYKTHFSARTTVFFHPI